MLVSDQDVVDTAASHGCAACPVRSAWHRPARKSGSKRGIPRRRRPALRGKQALLDLAEREGFEI